MDEGELRKRVLVGKNTELPVVAVSLEGALPSGGKTLLRNSLSRTSIRLFLIES